MLLDHVDAVQVENDTVYGYLQAAGWLRDCDGFYANAGEKRDTEVADWQLFADLLAAGPDYE